MNNLLDELWFLTLIEEKRELTTTEHNRYLEIFETLRNNDIDIPFGIEI